MVCDCILDDNEMAWQVDTDGKRGCAAYDGELSINVSGFDRESILKIHSSVVKSHSGVHAF